MREIPDEPDFAAEMETQGIPAESDFATELEWRCARHPLLMIAWVGVDYLVNELLMTQAAIEDKVKRSITGNGLCHMIQVRAPVPGFHCEHFPPARPSPPSRSSAIVRPADTVRMPGFRSGSARTASISSPIRLHSARYHSASSAES